MRLSGGLLGRVQVPCSREHHYPLDQVRERRRGQLGMTRSDLAEGLRRKTFAREALDQRPVELLVQCRLPRDPLTFIGISPGVRAAQGLSAEPFRLLQGNSRRDPFAKMSRRNCWLTR